MHETISKFPSGYFYDGLITDHQSIKERVITPMEIHLEKLLKSRMVFFDISCSNESIDEKSKYNGDEADFTQTLIQLIQSYSPQGRLRNIAGQIGVISPYKSQVVQVKNRLGPLCRSQNL
jgi:superfamily I DNA and/or RNA helicase